MSCLILALETSCDETAAAVVENGRIIRSSVVFSQMDLHALYGGVVPEIASRAHVEACDRVVDQALKEAGVSFGDLAALGVTQGPGLVGALLIGVSCMKGLSFATGLPLVPVHHIHGHICANFLSHPQLKPPFLCLVASGGHSHLFMVEDEVTFRLVGQTADDAAGEAFDKAARVLSLPYPGGPKLDQLAEEGDPHAFPLPRPKTEGLYDYSFSGLKTAFINLVHGMEQRGEALPRADLAASFRHALVESLVEKAMLAASAFHVPAVALAGGVSANRLLRRRMAEACQAAGLPFYTPHLPLCSDNGAMIASASYFLYEAGVRAPLQLNANPAMRLT